MKSFSSDLILNRFELKLCDRSPMESQDLPVQSKISESRPIETEHKSESVIDTQGENRGVTHDRAIQNESVIGEVEQRNPHKSNQDEDKEDEDKKGEDKKGENVPDAMQVESPEEEKELGEPKSIIETGERLVVGSNVDALDSSNLWSEAQVVEVCCLAHFSMTTWNSVNILY